ncbi:hypothetical protein GF340_03910 [Candidatus Peregrinibacteria bacterium]|nr:hypothetical protein [Candidatus Peregrinibacteria bacterium]
MKTKLWSKEAPLTIEVEGNNVYVEGKLLLTVSDQFPKEVYSRVLHTLSRDEGLFRKLWKYTNPEEHEEAMPIAV